MFERLIDGFADTVTRRRKVVLACVFLFVAFCAAQLPRLQTDSSPENLTKHWVNTTAIEPRNTPCYPCHKLHYGRGDCPIHEPTGSAICQWNTDPDEAYLAVLNVYEGWKRVQQFRRTVAA